MQDAVSGSPGFAGQDGAPVFQHGLDLAEVDAVQPLAVPDTIALVQAFADVFRADEVEPGAVQDADVNPAAGDQVPPLAGDSAEQGHEGDYQ